MIATQLGTSLGPVLALAPLLQHDLALRVDVGRVDLRRLADQRRQQLQRPPEEVRRHVQEEDRLLEGRVGVLVRAEGDAVGLELPQRREPRPVLLVARPEREVFQDVREAPFVVRLVDGARPDRNHELHAVARLVIFAPVIREAALRQHAGLRLRAPREWRVVVERTGPLRQRLEEFFHGFLLALLPVRRIAGGCHAVSLRATTAAPQSELSSHRRAITAGPLAYRQES